MRVLPVSWCARSTPAPLAPVAAVALGVPARALAARLLARSDEALAKLRGVGRSGTDEVLVILGEPADLPWLEGIIYLGRDPRAPSLLVPTLLEPDVPIELVERALLARVRSAGGDPSRVPLAVLPDVPLIVPCGGALVVVRSRLASFFGRAA